MERFKGGCACGAVRLDVQGRPLRVGLCHCMTCRRKHGSTFNPFAVFLKAQVFIAGSLNQWQSSERGRRYSCQTCSSPICYIEDLGEEIELNLGSFDEPGLFPPTYESWVMYREAWLPPLNAPQYSGNRPFPAEVAT